MVRDVSPLDFVLVLDNVSYSLNWYLYANSGLFKYGISGVDTNNTDIVVNLLVPTYKNRPQSILPIIYLFDSQAVGYMTSNRNRLLHLSSRSSLRDVSVDSTDRLHDVFKILVIEEFCG